MTDARRNAHSPLFQDKFYNFVRQGLMHYGALTGMEFPSMEYVDAPSTKLDAMLRILSHHLVQPGRPPLRLQTPEELEKADAAIRAMGVEPLETDVNKLVVDTAVTPPDGVVVLPREKIIVFIAFPKNIAAVECALESREIKYLAYNGNVEPTLRARKLREFQESKDVNVMVVSHVALAGLNLWFARVLVIVVSMRVALSSTCTNTSLGPALVRTIRSTAHRPPLALHAASTRARVSPRHRKLARHLPQQCVLLQEGDVPCVHGVPVGDTYVTHYYDVGISLT